MTAEVKRSTTEKLYQELEIEHLCSRCWFRKLCLFYKILKNKSLLCLFNLTPSSSRMHTTRNSNNITPFNRHNFFKTSFFPTVISEWNKRDLEICNSAFLEIFKKYLLNFIRTKSNNVFNINNLLRLKFLTHLRIGFSLLKEHKFKHNFQDSLHPLCRCGIDIESIAHFFSPLRKFYNSKIDPFQQTK